MSTHNICLTVFVEKEYFPRYPLKPGAMSEQIEYNKGQVKGTS